MSQAQVRTRSLDVSAACAWAWAWACKRDTPDSITFEISRHRRPALAPAPAEAARSGRMPSAAPVLKYVLVLLQDVPPSGSLLTCLELVREPEWRPLTTHISCGAPISGLSLFQLS